MKVILLLGGSAQQVIAIQKAKDLGYKTILCDYLPDNPGQFIADVFYQTSTTDKEAVLKIAQEEKIDGILAYASDPAAPTAAYVAEKMGLPTNPYNSVETLCNKAVFRAFLSAHGFNIPKAKDFYNEEHAMKELDYFSFPIIIKPVDSSGSKGITKLDSPEGFTNAMHFAFLHSRSHHIIIEEVIENKYPYLFGGDIFISEGKVILWGLMNCHRDNSVNPLVPVGKSYPAILNAVDLQEVKKTLQRLISISGIRLGSVNVEIIIDKSSRVFLIDIGPRAGGNMIPELLSMVFNCDLVEMIIRSAMGERIAARDRTEDAYFATHNLHSNKTGKLKSIQYSERISQYIVRESFYKHAGEPVSYFANASDALGILFMKFPDMKTMIEIEDQINEHVKIKLDNMT